MTLTFSGSEMWSSFDFGVISGVMYFPNRPRRSCEDSIPFQWRGREDQGPVSFANSSKSWVNPLMVSSLKGELTLWGLGLMVSEREAKVSRVRGVLVSLRASGIVIRNASMSTKLRLAGADIEKGFLEFSLDTSVLMYDM